MDDNKKNEGRKRRPRVFQGGRYAVLPVVIAERTDISGNSKVVWSRLYDRQGDNNAAWPGVAWIATAAGCGRRTAIRAVAELEAAGLMTVERRHGCPNVYRIMQPAAKAKLVEGDQCQTGTSAKKSPVPKGDRHQCQNGTVFIPSIQPHQKNTPQPPALRGEERAASDGQDAERAKRWIIGDLDVACEAVFGTPTPGRWRRRLERMNGEIVMFAGVKAQDIRAAQAKAAGQKRSFGFGWLENHMRERAAAARTQIAAQAAAAAGAEPEAVRAARAKADADREAMLTAAKRRQAKGATP